MKTWILDEDRQDLQVSKTADAVKPLPAVMEDEVGDATAGPHYTRFLSSGEIRRYLLAVRGHEKIGHTTAKEVVTATAGMGLDLLDENERLTKFCAGVDLDQLKRECGKPGLTLSDLVRAGDELADETHADERKLSGLLAAATQLLAGCEAHLEAQGYALQISGMIATRAAIARAAIAQAKGGAK